MTTLYEVLGIDRRSTPEEIKSAYRRLAMVHHPDRQGDPVQFKLVKEAYEVLSDPERRARYDETGATDQPLTIRQAAEAMIPTLVTAAVDKSPDLVFTDLVAKIRLEVAGILGEDRRAHAEALRQHGRFNVALKRFTRKGGENMAAAALQSQVDAAVKYMEGNEQHQLLLLEVLEVLEDYSYVVDARQEGAFTVRWG